MRHNGLYHTTLDPPYRSASRQCLYFVMKSPTYDPTQNLLRVPCFVLTAPTWPVDAHLLGRRRPLPTDAHNILQLHVHATPTVSPFALH